MSRWHRLLERLLPWYRSEVEFARNRHTEQIRRDAINARISAEKVRQDYAEMSSRLKR